MYKKWILEFHRNGVKDVSDFSRCILAQLFKSPNTYQFTNNSIRFQNEDFDADSHVRKNEENKRGKPEDGYTETFFPENKVQVSFFLIT